MYVEGRMGEAAAGDFQTSHVEVLGAGVEGKQVPSSPLHPDAT